MHVVTDQRSKVVIAGHVTYSYLVQQLVDGSLSLMFQDSLLCLDTHMCTFLLFCHRQCLRSTSTITSAEAVAMVSEEECDKLATIEAVLLEA